ncbi:PEP-CTERM sorting domain-containing protein [Aquisalimonas sp.]|uniref:PEP-CTERM sorting domain-containing protein n=1 Tax=unclassified Aquisalimonas TaxID=2644645 RepID=UPI0025B98035|nr:PEP-CTERM sorting domain-containing protein [Aquisalimonas sp.]
MHVRTTSLSLLAAAPVLGFTLWSAQAGASVINCNTLDPDISDRVTPSTGCQILEPIGGNTNDSLSVINDNQFFGFNDWLFDGKWEAPQGGGPLFNDPDDPSAFIDVDGDEVGGEWSLALPDFWDNNSELMFIFKDGAFTNLVGYLIETNATGGTYQTPFTFPPFEHQGQGVEQTDISHISVYYRANGVHISEPGVLALFGLGLIGLAWSARRRSHNV